MCDVVTLIKYISGNPSVFTRVKISVKNIKIRLNINL